MISCSRNERRFLAQCPEELRIAEGLAEKQGDYQKNIHKKSGIGL